MAAAGVRWLALNVGDHPPWSWDVVRQRAQQAGVAVIPWARLAQPGQPLDVVRSRIDILASTGRAWNAPAILPNYEKEAETISPSQIAIELVKCDWPRLVGFSTQGWLSNAVDYGPLNRHPVLLQCFPADGHWPVDEVRQKTLDCVYHARDKGFTYVGVTFQTYGMAEPGWYDVASYQHSVYPGDGLYGHWSEWFA